MSTNQKLADIQALVEYIKAHVEVDTHAQLNRQVDTIGATALTIATNLEQLSKQVDSGQEEAFTQYKDLAGKLAEDMCEKLQEISKTVKQEHETTLNTLEQITEVHNAYVGVLAENDVRFKQQQTAYETDISDIGKQMSDINQILSDTQEKIIAKETLSKYIEAVQKQLTQIEANDQKLYQTYETRMTTQTQRFTDLSDSFVKLDNDITSIDESFKTAVGRLDILSMKLDILTNSVGGDTNAK